MISLGPVLTALLLLVSYPTIGVPYVAWVALVPLLWSAARARIRARFLAGCALGGALWGAAIFYPLFFVEDGTWIQRTVGFLALVIALAVFLFLFGRMSLPSPKKRPMSVMGMPPPSFLRRTMKQMASVFYLAGLWVVLEYLLRWIAAGFSPYFGLTQWEMGFASSVASVGGVYAVSWLLVAVNGLVAHLVLALTGTDPAPKRSFQMSVTAREFVLSDRVFPALFGAAALGLVVSYGSLATGLPPSLSEGSAGGGTIELHLVQPNFTPARYNESFTVESQRELMYEAIALTDRSLFRRGGAGENSLVIWPETVLHVDALALPDFQLVLAASARRWQSNLLIGLPTAIEGGSIGHRQAASSLNTDSFVDRISRWFGGPAQERNSAILLSSDGRVIGQYDKVYVIPIAEAQFAAGHEVKPLEVGGLSLGIGICSDVVVGDHAWQAVRAGATSLHYIASLGRIGTIVQLEQALLALRAAEHGVFVTQTATTGPTVVVDPRGRIVNSLPQDEPGVLSVTLHIGAEPGTDSYSGGVFPGTDHSSDLATDVMVSTPTPYTRFGDWPVLFSAVMVIGLGLLGRGRASK